MVARENQEKSWAELIHAFEQVLKVTFLEVHLIVVGDSQYLRNLKASLDSCDSMATRVHFVGYSCRFQLLDRMF